MTYKTQILLGRITKVYSHDGTVNVRLEKRFVEKIPFMESVFLEVEGKPVPFLIISSEYPGGDVLRLRFDGYESIERVSEFTGCQVFLTQSVIPEKNNYSDYSFIDGYLICLPDKTKIGTIKEIISNPGQILALVLTPDDKEIYIPLHEDLILSSDKKKKIIFMDLPEGLIDLN